MPARACRHVFSNVLGFFVVFLANLSQHKLVFLSTPGLCFFNYAMLRVCLAAHLAFLISFLEFVLTLASVFGMSKD